MLDDYPPVTLRIWRSKPNRLPHAEILHLHLLALHIERLSALPAPAASTN